MESNGNRSRRITRNTFYLYVSEGFSRLFTWALIVYLTRTWEVSTYGQYATAVNWTAIFVVISEVGLNALTVREVAQRKELAVFYLRNVMIIRSVLSVMFWALMIFLAFLLHYEPILKIVLAVLGLRIILDSAAGGYVYLLQSHEEMGLYSLVNVATGLIRWVGIILIVHFGGGVVGAGAGWAIASGTALIILVVIGYRKGWKPSLSEFQMAEALNIFKKSFPLATFGALQMIYYRVDSVILKSFSGNEVVGYYDLASKIFFMILLIPQLYTTAIYPVLSSVQGDSTVFGKMVFQSIKILILIALPITVGGAFLAGPMMELVGGARYAASGPIFAILMFSVIPFFLLNAYASVLAIKNTFRLNLHFLILSILNILLNFLMIPRFGAIGSACASVICGFIGLGLGFWFAHPYLSVSWKRFIWPVLGALLASSLMGAGIWWQPKLFWLALGPLVYGAGLWLFRVLDDEDWEKIKAFRK